MSTTPPTENKTAQNTPAEKSHWLAWIASAFSALTVVLLLLGYGVTLGIETSTGIPHGSLTDSPADFIELSSIALGELISVLGAAFFKISSYERLVAELWLPLVGASIALLLMFATAYFWKKNKKPRAAANKNINKQVAKKPTSFAWQHWKIYLQVQGFLLALPVILLSGMAIMVYSIALIGLIPLIGMKATESYFKHWVIEPEVCLPLKARQFQLQPPSKTATKKGVSCVKVSKDGNELGTGRVAVSTSKTIVLYTPKDGAVKRIPLDGAVIDLIADLPQ